MKFLTNRGLYLHIPFCQKRCAYCDFYSGVYTAEMADKYTGALVREIKKWGGLTLPINTIYFGGGTPSLLGERLVDIILAIKESFSVAENSEITLELNPQPDIESVLELALKVGINRLSIGVQTASDEGLKLLGRTHTKADAENAVKIARRLGFSNISLDLMIGLPNSSLETLQKDLEFLVSQNPEHISCYILKIEENTVFYKKKDTLNLPDEDNVSDQYLFMCEYLKNNGYSHYEISNFCKSNYESRHNLKYWNCEEYIGIGPSAHSFYNGERFYYPKDLKGFLKGNEPIFDSSGGESQEQIMLKLRLKRGVEISELSPEAKEKCELFSENGLGEINNKRFSLTDKGMLVSNAIITEILEVL